MTIFPYVDNERACVSFEQVLGIKTCMTNLTIESISGPFFVCERISWVFDPTT